MKLSLKKLAVAVALAATAASASAAIDNGAGGNGELFFNAWDANGSYSFDLNQLMNDWVSTTAILSSATGTSQVLSSGSFDYTFSLTNFSSFLSGADASTLQWNVVATDGSGARRTLSTYSEMPETAKTADVLRTLSGGITNHANAINGATTNDWTIVDAANPAYAGQELFSTNYNSLANFSNAGTLANNSYESGLNFMRIDAKSTGIQAGIYTQLFAGADAVKVYIDADNVLHLAAMPVPEPESYAMLLAGLGMVGFMARRRLGKRA